MLLANTTDPLPRTWMVTGKELPVSDDTSKPTRWACPCLLGWVEVVQITPKPRQTPSSIHLQNGRRGHGPQGDGKGSRLKDHRPRNLGQWAAHLPGGSSCPVRWVHIPMFCQLSITAMLSKNSSTLLARPGSTVSGSLSYMSPGQNLPERGIPLQLDTWTDTGFLKLPGGLKGAIPFASMDSCRWREIPRESSVWRHSQGVWTTTHFGVLGWDARAGSLTLRIYLDRWQLHKT